MDTLRIATRKSPLALWQAEHVAARLREVHPQLHVELVPLSTRGDKLLDAPLAKVGGKALFVKELESAMLDGRADIAVHSMKDVPVTLPPGFHLPVILEREDPRDALVSPRYSNFDSLPEGARVGTCSLRRRVQLLARRPDFRILDLRGNVGTRLGKLDAGDYDAIVLACAGLKRLMLDDRIAEALPPATLLPAIGQGAMGIECVAGDARVESVVAPLNDPATTQQVLAERAVNACLGGSCTMPVAGYATPNGDGLRLEGLVGRLDGSEILRETLDAPANDAEALGRAVGEALAARGAADIIASAADGYD